MLCVINKNFYHIQLSVKTIKKKTWSDSLQLPPYDCGAGTCALAGGGGPGVKVVAVTGGGTAPPKAVRH